MAPESPALADVRTALLAIAADGASPEAARAGALQLLQEIRGGTPALLRLLQREGDVLAAIDAGPGRGSLRAELIRCLGGRVLRGDAPARAMLRRETLRRSEGAYATPFVGPLWRAAHLGLIADRDPRALQGLADGLPPQRLRALLLGWVPPARASELLVEAGLSCPLPAPPRPEPVLLRWTERLLDATDPATLLDEFSNQPEPTLRGLRAMLLLLLHAPQTRTAALGSLRGLAGPSEVGTLLMMVAAEPPGEHADALAGLAGACWSGGPRELVAALGRAGEAIRWDTTPPQERVRRALLAVTAAGLPVLDVAGALGAGVDEGSLREGSRALGSGMVRIRFEDRARVATSEPALSYGRARVAGWWRADSRARAVLGEEPEDAGAELLRGAEQDPAVLVIADRLARRGTRGTPSDAVLDELLGQDAASVQVEAAGRRLALRAAHRATGLQILGKARQRGLPTGRTLAWLLLAGGDDRRAAEVLGAERSRDPSAHVELAALGIPADEGAAAWANDPRAALGRAMAPSTGALEQLVAEAWLCRAAALGHAEASARLAGAVQDEHDARHHARRALDLDQGVPAWGPLS